MSAWAGVSTGNGETSGGAEEGQIPMWRQLREQNSSGRSGDTDFAQLVVVVPRRYEQISLQSFFIVTNNTDRSSRPCFLFDRKTALGFLGPRLHPLLYNVPKSLNPVPLALIRFPAASINQAYRSTIPLPDPPSIQAITLVRNWYV